MRGWKIAAAFFAIIAVFVLAFLLNTFVFNPVRQAGRIVERTIDADNVIYNYEWFRQQCHDVIARANQLADVERDLASLEASAGPRSTWGFETSQEWNRLNTIRGGRESSLDDMISTYNARSAMANRALFQDNRLPDTIPLDPVGLACPE